MAVVPYKPKEATGGSTVQARHSESPLGKEGQRGYIQSGSGGGPGGGGGELEVKVARLETHMSHLQDSMGEVKQRLTGVEGRVGGVEINLATLTERVAHLPSKGYIVTTVVLAGSFFTAITLFSDSIKKLFGL